jgi:sec-independent protein translocase protein TatA
MGRFGLGELLVIAGVVVLLVGAKRLPELGRSMGQALREFQKAIKGSDKSDTNDKS